ncbi:hypothetical protein IWQ56_002758 [Coemansia nantahalensis]|nr:hypothetical protein IWQ56_002758 [Coemansia nantahalensis]
MRSLLWQRPRAAFARRAAAGRRGFACLSVYVNYGTHETTTSDLRALFEQVGSVWDVEPVEAGTHGRQLTRALVRFYAGDHELRDGPAALPPPSDAEMEAVSKAVDDAISRFDHTMLNGAQIFVVRADKSPWQLHRWLEGGRAAKQAHQARPRPDIFPVNPFYGPARRDDDYQRGFMAGFRLGLKDGAREPSDS